MSSSKVGFNVPPKHIIGHIGDDFLQVKSPNQQCQALKDNSCNDEVNILVFLQREKTSIIIKQLQLLSFVMVSLCSLETFWTSLAPSFECT